MYFVNVSKSAPIAQNTVDVGATRPQYETVIGDDF